MPIEVEIPGQGVIEFPDGMTDDQISQAIQKNFGTTTPYDPAADMSGTDRFLAGAGKAFSDIGKGARQIGYQSLGLSGRMLGLNQRAADSIAKKELDKFNAEIEETRKLDAPLMKTGAGVTGNVIGNIAAALPSAFVPGANTAVGATLTGGLLGALQPTASGESRALNTALGAGTGIAGYGVGKGIGSAVSSAKNKVAALAAQKSQNAARDAALEASRKAGYVVPPSEVKPNILTNVLERWAGKASLGQEASLRNQQVTNKLVRETLGVADNKPITPELLTSIRSKAGKAYENLGKFGYLTADDQYTAALGELDEGFKRIASDFPELANEKIGSLVKALDKQSFSSKSAVELTKKLRSDGFKNIRNPDSQISGLGRAQLGAASAVEDLIERNLEKAGQGGLLSSFRSARQKIAISHSVEDALNDVTGDVSSRELAKQLSKGKPLSKGLKTAARFATAFPKHNQQNVNQVIGGSPLDTGLAVGTSAVTGNPGWLAIAMGRPLARSAVLSPMLATNPNYNPGVISRGLSGVGNAAESGLGQKLLPYIRPMPGLLGPSIYAAQE